MALADDRFDGGPGVLVGSGPQGICRPILGYLAWFPRAGRRTSGCRLLSAAALADGADWLCGRTGSGHGGKRSFSESDAVPAKFKGLVHLARLSAALTMPASLTSGPLLQH